MAVKLILQEKTTENVSECGAEENKLDRQAVAHM
jgi:hypothetical protein